MRALASTAAWPGALQRAMAARFAATVKADALAMAPIGMGIGIGIGIAMQHAADFLDADVPRLGVRRRASQGR